MPHLPFPPDLLAAVAQRPPLTTPARPGRWRAGLAVAAGAALLSACGHMGHGDDRGMGHHEGHSMGPHARAELQPTRGHAAAGWVMFHAEDGGVFMHAHVTGLKPQSIHGFHIHDKGDCSSGDGLSTGGHFNPGAHRHGPQNGEHHAGDLPALQADAGGVADLKVKLPGLAIGDGATNIVGRGLIVHADADDFQTQPTGNSGARIACGVIQPPAPRR